ncbi:MAG: hypothetical protein Q9179_007446, partial [Wetmoreana sp. 5 TL-2023]
DQNNNNDGDDVDHTEADVRNINPLLFLDESANVKSKDRPKGSLNKRQENSTRREPSAFEHIEARSRG